MSLEYYKLDLVYFYTAPGLSLKALLKRASDYCEHEVKYKYCSLCLDKFILELLPDIDMMLMFAKGIRGLITQAVKRYVKANNKHMKEQYSPDETSTYHQYLDANNLYGWAMIQNRVCMGKSRRFYP